MRARTAIARVSAAATIIALPCVLALTSLLPLISPIFLRLQYARPDVPPSSRFTPEERQTLAEAAAYYLISSEGIDYLASIVDAEGTPLFNDRELTHMVDVKILLGKAIKLDIVLALVLAASLTILLGRVETRPRTPFYLLIGALVAPALAVSAMIVVPLQFRWFFVEFHHLFFEGESWLFPRSDTLIQLFPEQFWFDALQTWLFLILAVSLALAIGTYVWLRRKKRTANS